MSSGEKEQKGLTRRQFMRGAATGAATLAGVGVWSTAAAQQPAADIPTTWDQEADIVIVGYGGGGIGAAIAAQDAGAKVLVLEKDTEPRGGNTGCSGGSCCIGNTDQGAIDYLRSMCWGTVADEELIKTHALATRALPTWIEGLGGKVYWSKLQPTYPLLPGADEFGGDNGTANIDIGGGPGDGHALYQFFLGVATDKKINVMLNTAGKQLIQDPNSKEILGIVAESDGKKINVKARKAVILATGGYENNEEMRKNFAPHAHSAFITQYGTPLNTGDGLVMAQRVGAKLWHMNKKECHSFAGVAASKELGTGITVAAYGNQIGNLPGIIVNRDGKRFMNEYFNSGHSDQHRAYDEFEHKHLPTDDYEYSDYRNVPMYWIFDDTRMKAGPLRTSQQWVGIHELYTWSKDNEAELAKGWFVKADTIAALAEQIVIKDFFGKVVGMDADGLLETVQKYNQYAVTGWDLDFGRRPSTMKPLSTPPFYAMEVCECQTNTQGGPQRNQYNQTLDMDGNPIPRLYSVGELGSIYGFLYNGGGNVPESYATGKIAAEHAITLDPWDAGA